MCFGGKSWEVTSSLENYLAVCDGGRGMQEVEHLETTAEIQARDDSSWPKWTC